jgi:hypothetical protein
MMNDPFAIPSPDDPIELAPVGGVLPILDDDQAKGRAMRIQYGLDDILKKSYEEIYSGLQNGSEADMRAEAAAELSLRKQSAAENAIKAFAAKKPTELQPEEIQGLRTMIDNMRKDVDPSTVFEEAYGKKYLTILDEIARRNPDMMWNDILKEKPQMAAAATDVGSTTAAKRAYINTQLQNLQAEARDQRWIPWTADMLKYLFPGYEETKLRGNVNTTGFNALGPALEAQRKALMDMDWDSGEFKTKVDEIAARLKADNPSAAVEFMKAMQGLDPEEQAQKSLGIAFDLLGIPIVKGIRKLFRHPDPTEGGGLVTFDRMTGKVKKTEPFEQTWEQARDAHAQRAVDQINNMGPFNMDDVLRESAEKAVKDVVKSADKPAQTKADILEDAGDVGEAAVQKATAELTKLNKGIQEPLEQAKDSLFSVYKGMETSLQTNTGSASRELVTRITDMFRDTRVNLAKVLEESQRIERLPEVLANEDSVRKIKDFIKDKYRGYAVLDIPRFYDETISNTRYAEVHLGTPEAELFTSPMVANNYRYTHGLKDFTIESKGTGYYLKGFRPFEETSNTLRDLIAKDDKTTVPMGNWGNISNYIRTPEETTSLAQRNNAKIATSVPARAQEIIADSYKPIKALRGWFGYNSSKKWRDLRDVMKAAQEVPDGEGKGVFFDTIQDFEDFFYRSKGFKPDEQQIEGYFAFTRGMELDRMFRNVAEHKFMAREGAETHKFYYTVNADTNQYRNLPVNPNLAKPKPEGTRVYSPEITGVVRNHMPKGTDVVAIIKPNGEARISNLQTMAKGDWDLFNFDVKSGKGQLIEIWNPEHRPLDGFAGISNERVRYVLSYGTETSQLKWDHIPRRGGGHMEYDNQFFIKQPNIIEEVVGDTRRKWYEGDTTIMPIAVRAMGKDVADKLDTIRVLLKEGKTDEARDFARKSIHIEWNVLEGWFKPKYGPDGKLIPARLNLNEKIRVVERNKTIMKSDNELQQKYLGKRPDDADWDEFRDGTNEGSLARQYQVAYTEERDAERLFTVKSEEDGPLYKLADVETVDPISTMNRALNRITKSNYLDDYKMASVEHWLEQAKNFLKLDNPDQIRYAPWKYYTDPEWLPGFKGTKEHTAFMNAKIAIDSLVGKPSVVDTWMDSASQYMIDSIYKRAGEDAAIYSQRLLTNTQNPFTFVRGVTFHMKLGSFNPAQFLAQSMTYTNIWGIAGPQAAAPATLGAQLHFWSTLNGRKPILDHLDKLASNLNIPGALKWKPGQLKESILEGEKTGFFNVRNYALDNPFASKIVGTVAGDVLDAGTIFFRGGERNSKTGAWHTAYLEYRRDNPFTKIDNAERAKILERADLLNNNMTKASNSVLHTGVLSVPTQFYTYQIRATELLTGKRLDKYTKARLLFMNSLAYGLPVGAGLTGVPFSDAELPFVGSLRTYAKENGYVVGEKFWSTMVMEGALGYAMFMATGKAYNPGDRLGAKGLESLNTLWRGDDFLWKFAGGAAGGMMKSILDTTDGFWAWARGMMGANDHFPVMGSDLMALAKENSTINSLDTFYNTLNIGRQLSKKGAFIAEADTTDAFIKLFTGIQSQDASDLQRMTHALKNQDEKWKRATQWAQREIRDGMRAQDANNQEQAQKYYTRAKAILDMYDVPHRDRMKAYANGVSTEKSLVEKLNYDWAIRKAPTAKQDQRFEIERRRLEREKGNQ